MTKKNTTNNEMTFSFPASLKHVATSGKLAAYDGRKSGGVDLYLPVMGLADNFAGLPEEVEIVVSIRATGAVVDDATCVVPRTMQNQFSEAKAMFSEVYGMGITDYIESMLDEEEEKPARKPGRKASKPAKATPAKPASNARTTRTRKATPATPAQPVAKAAQGMTRKAKPGTAPASAPVSLSEQAEKLAALESKIDALINAIS